MYCSYNFTYVFHNMELVRIHIRDMIFDDEQLPDGVHPDDQLKEKWFNRIISVCDKKPEAPKEPLTDSQTEEEEESWDYKRPKTTR